MFSTPIFAPILISAYSSPNSKDFPKTEIPSSLLHFKLAMLSADNINSNLFSCKMYREYSSSIFSVVDCQVRFFPIPFRREILQGNTFSTFLETLLPIIILPPFHSFYNFNIINFFAKMKTIFSFKIIFF